MAQGQPNMPVVNHFVSTAIHDLYGVLVLLITLRDFTVFEPDGTVSQYKHNDSVQLVDGLEWSPGIMVGGEPILLTVCPTCRNPPVSFFRYERATHGLLSVRNARVCVNCGIVTCPRHRRLIGGRWRCLSCARWYRVKRVVRPIFFSSHEEP